MKRIVNKTVTCIAILVMLLTNATIAQNVQKEGYSIYKSDHWADTKGKGGFAKAMESPMQEKVEIRVSDKNIKVTLGIKVYKYAVVSSSPFSEYRMDYNVTHNGKSFVLAIAILPDNRTAIGIEGMWMVPDAVISEQQYVFIKYLRNSIEIIADVSVKITNDSIVFDKQICRGTNMTRFKILHKMEGESFGLNKILYSIGDEKQRLLISVLISEKYKSLDDTTKVKVLSVDYDR